MEEKMKLILSYLKQSQQSLATMESCTGGALASAITNVEGASDVFHFGAITYSNDAKINMGVSPEIIEKYTVYSMPVARFMASAIAKKANATYGIGITGRFGTNPEEKSDYMVYISIYDANQDCYLDQTIGMDLYERKVCKNMIVELVTLKLFDMIFQNR